MSIAEFSQVLRNKAIKSWLTPENTDPKPLQPLSSADKVNPLKVEQHDDKLEAQYKYYSNATIDIYAKSDKSIDTQGNISYTLEIEPGISEKQLQLLKLFDPKSTQLQDIARSVRQSLQDQAFRTILLNLRSSPSILEMISKKIRDTLQGVKSSQKHSTPKSKVASKKPKTNKLVKPSKQLKTGPLRNISGQFYSLTSLQMLLDTHLQDVVSANMGDQPYKGGQRRILNYDTGRFAASVKVERLMMSKEGMITAFYNYMKYPYQTFEPGFKQGSPKTRNPRLLIAKSIAEIAALKVANRMRSVLV